MIPIILPITIGCTILTRGRHHGPGNKSTILYSTFSAWTNRFFSALFVLLFCCLDLCDRLDLGTKSGLVMEIGALFCSDSSDDESEDNELSLDDDAPLPLLDDEELPLLHCYMVYACGTGICDARPSPVIAKPGNSHHFRTALLRQGTD